MTSKIDAAALIRQARALARISQSALAARAGTSQPAIARLECGTASPSLVTLERILAAAGFSARVVLEPLVPADPVIAAYGRDVDRSLLRENLRRTVDDRLQSLAEADEVGRALRRAVRARARTP